MKKIVSLVLALALVLTAAVCLVSAEEEAETPVSAGKTYTVSKVLGGEATYWINGDQTVDLKDDGVRLTDGNKGSQRGATTDLDYTAVNGLGDDGEGVVVTVDLGEVKSVDEFKVYICHNEGWGIGKLNFLRVKCSVDGDSYVEAGTVSGEGEEYLEGATGWVPYVQTIALQESVEARYVQFEIYNNGNFCWVDEVEVYEGEPAAPAATFPAFPDNLWDIFSDGDNAVVVDGVKTGKFQGSDSDCGDAFAYLCAYDKEFVYVAIVTNYAGIGSPDNMGNGKGTNLRLWFRTNDEAEVYTHFVDIQYAGQGNVVPFGKKCGSLTANENTSEISTEGVVAEAAEGTGSLFMQAKIPFSVIEATDDFGMFITVSNGKTENIENHAIIAPFDADCEFAKADLDTTKNNTFFPYTSWNSAAIIIPINDDEPAGDESEPAGGDESEPAGDESEPAGDESEPAGDESENEGQGGEQGGQQGGNDPAPQTGDAGIIALAVVSVIALGGAVIVKKSK